MAETPADTQRAIVGIAATPADTHREIVRLRGDMDAALGEIQRRLRGGLRTVATAEASITSSRARQDMATRAGNNLAVVGVVGLLVLGGIGYAAYRVVTDSRERQKPQNRLRREVRQARDEFSGRVSAGVDASRRQLEQHQRHLLLKLDPEDGGYVRVTDARLQPANKGKGRTEVIKKLVWAGLLSVFLAVSSVLARRVAGRVWRATVREDPPTEKGKAPS